MGTSWKDSDFVSQSFHKKELPLKLQVEPITPLALSRILAHPLINIISRLLLEAVISQVCCINKSRTLEDFQHL